MCCSNSDFVYLLKFPPENGPKDNLLIEGCAEFSNMMEIKSFVGNRRIYGEKCGLDVKFLLLTNAVQAFVDVEILRAPACGLNLNLYAKTSGLSDVIRLYQGTAEWLQNEFSCSGGDTQLP